MKALQKKLSSEGGRGERDLRKGGKGDGSGSKVGHGFAGLDADSDEVWRFGNPLF